MLRKELKLKKYLKLQVATLKSKIKTSSLNELKESLEIIELVLSDLISEAPTQKKYLELQARIKSYLLSMESSKDPLSEANPEAAIYQENLKVLDSILDDTNESKIDVSDDLSKNVPTNETIDENLNSKENEIERTAEALNDIPLEEDELLPEEALIQSPNDTPLNPLETLYEKYVLPTANLLSLPKKSEQSNDEFIENTKKRLNQAFSRFAIDAEVVEVTEGPLYSLFEVELKNDATVRKVESKTKDFEIAIGGAAIRIISPIPGKTTLGIEVPNQYRQDVYFYEVASSPIFLESKKPLTIGYGKDVYGKIVVDSIAEFPHALISGQTGSGKSVGLQSVITSLLFKYKPDEVKMVLIDMKATDLRIFSKIPHLVVPFIDRDDEAIATLKWAQEELEKRNRLLADNEVMNIEQFNELGKKKIPYLVIIIDEVERLIQTSKQTETQIQDLVQRGRSSGVHVILVNQRPSVDVINGKIKANLGGRISFKAKSIHDSKTVLDTTGAEALTGKGDMIVNTQSHVLKRLLGAYLNLDDIKAITQFIKDQAPQDIWFDPNETVN